MKYTALHKTCPRNVYIPNPWGRKRMKFYCLVIAELIIKVTFQNNMSVFSIIYVPLQQ